MQGGLIYMNIMIITERAKTYQASLSRLMWAKNPNGQRFFVIGFEGKAESALSQVFDHNTKENPNNHLVIVADDISHLWQGVRPLLDIVLETRSSEVEEWFVDLLHGMSNSSDKIS
jgi:hypothetical protein